MPIFEKSGDSSNLQFLQETYPDLDYLYYLYLRGYYRELNNGHGFKAIFKNMLNAKSEKSRLKLQNVWAGSIFEEATKLQSGWEEKRKQEKIEAAEREKERKLVEERKKQLKKEKKKILLQNF